MMAVTQSRLRLRAWWHPREATSGVGFAIIILLALLLPIVGHGCHGDDVDHEPATKPYEHPQETRR